MSIIYDALKRIESKKTKDTKNNLTGPKRVNSKFPRIVYIICTLIILGLLAFFVSKLYVIAKSFIGKRFLSSFPVSQKLPASKRKPPVQIKPLPAAGEKTFPSVKHLPPLSITGIFLIDGEHMALINDQMVRAGDFIEGVQIDRINSNGVEIKFKGSTFQLNYP